jgi:hypothetical protein
MRAEELAGRTGKQIDGSAKTREVKICAVWSAEARDSEGPPRRIPPEHRSAFAERVLREASRRRFSEAQRMVVVADGAPWIWNIAQDRLPGAIPIVDRFHVKQTLHRTAQALFGSTVEQAKQGATARCLELDNGKLSAVVRALRPHAGDCADAARCRLYIYRNRRRMRYPQFHKQGLCTSSGVLEAGCKVAIGTRLKRSGMHWTIANDCVGLERRERFAGDLDD